MSATPEGMVPILLPAEVVTRIAELKQDRPEDRARSVDEIVRRLCERYIGLREKVREAAARKDDIERSYLEHPDDWDDAEVWREGCEQLPKDT